MWSVANLRPLSRFNFYHLEYCGKCGQTEDAAARMKAVRHNRMYGGVINIPGDIITGRVSPDSERSGSPRRMMKTDRNTLRRRRRRAGGFQRQREILDAVDERSARLLASTTRRLRG